MTALGLAIAGIGLILLWAAWTGESPFDIVASALGVNADEG